MLYHPKAFVCSELGTLLYRLANELTNIDDIIDDIII